MSTQLFNNANRAMAQEAMIQNSVLITSPRPVIAQGLKTIIEQERNIKKVIIAATLARAFDVFKAEPLAVSLLDFHVKYGMSLDAIYNITSYSQVPLVAVSDHEKRYYERHCLKAGARGYIPMNYSTDKILKAIHIVEQGQVYFSESTMNNFLSNIKSKKAMHSAVSEELLTARELEVYELLGEGINTREIAKTLDLSIKTVECHREKIKEKLGLEDSVQLIHAATLKAVNILI